MRDRIRMLVLGVAGLAVIAASAGVSIAAGGEHVPTAVDRTASAKAFETAKMRIEVNGTDGDAGIQVNLDGRPWRAITIYGPDGREILDIHTKSDMRNFGLTELFTESNEPPFARFPLDDFKALFPEGDYLIVGDTIDGKRLVSTATLSHNIPEGPVILSPEDGATVPNDHTRVRWEPVSQPEGVEIVGYQVTLERQDPFRVYSVDLPADARSVRIPADYLEPGVEYSTEVLAIDASGNQTLTNITFIAG